MNKMEWKQDYSTGNELLDLQHKKLFDIFNRLVDSDNKKGHFPDADFHEQLNELAEFTRTHIKTENDLLLSYGYPNYQEHVAEHSAFEQELAYLLCRACDANVDKVELINFVYKKWVGHIINSDLKFAYLFKK